MIKIFHFVKQYYREIFRGSYFFAAILLILIALPKERRFKYEFQRGMEWMHEDLVAPFDFPIYKTDAEFIAERNAILNNFKPFFKYDTSAVVVAIKQLNTDYDRELVNLGLEEKPNDSILNQVTAEIKRIHLAGIMLPAEFSDLRSEIQTGITIVKNNQAYEVDIEEVYQVNRAVDNIKSHVQQLVTEKKGSEIEALKKLNFTKYVKPNLEYDSQTTQQVTDDMLANLSATKGLIYAGERIISKGEVVNSDLYQILYSLKREFEGRLNLLGNTNLLLLGQALIITILFLILFLFLYNFRKEVLYSDSKIIFILLLISSLSVISFLLLRRDLVSIYIIPFAIVPIFIRTFYDSRLALFIHIVTAFLVGFFVPNSFEFVFLQFSAGVVAIIGLTKVYRRSKLFLAVGYIFLTYSALYFGIVLIQDGNPSSMNVMYLAWFAANALLLLASYQLIYVFEKVFGFLSDTTLMELGDTNQDLLRKLAEIAPGTFQHSLQVANLAESAIHQIGGNPLLVRTGALYHDIGKMNNPYYFTENQAPDFNPHQGLDFEKSAEIIIRHITDGIQIAKKHRLPQQIIDFIRTHHGTNKVLYFYRLFKDKFPEAKDDLKVFNYPGPKPFSRETAVVMMADSVEAASRALKNITLETINELVETIINYQQIEEQFNEADITFKDISIIKEVFKKKLQNIYHARIEYPKEKVEA
jgi:putative nucleotidyltransferase with HDIG domain